MRVFDSRKLLTVGVLLLLLTLAVNGAASREAAAVKDVSINSAGSSLEVRIATSERAQYTYFELSHPHRLVVDFHGIQNNVGFKEKSIDMAGVARVRTSYFTDKNRKAARIVFDLAENVPYKISDDADGNVRVLFGEEPAVTLVAGPNLVPAPSVPESEAKPLPSVVQVPATPAPQPPPPAPQAPAAPAATPVPATPASPQIPPSLAQNQKPQTYNGEIIDIDVKDLDLKDFFRLIGSISGLNVVVDSSVAGTQTMTLTGVPWDQALDVVLKYNNLGSQLQGNVLRIARNETLQAEENARKTLQDSREQIADLMTKTYILNYTKVDAVTPMVTKMLSGARGSIIPEPRRNALIVTDLPTQFSKIDQLVQFLDVPAQQVEIEARLLSANKSFSKELGTQLGFILGNKSNNKIAGPGSTGSSPFTRSPSPGVTVGGASVPLNVNLPAAGTSGISFLMGFGADVILDEIITAAEARGTAKVISRPKVVTQNNQAATVQQGTQIPVQSNQNNTVSVQFLQFALQLNVTPQITDVGTILLTVAIENSQPDFARAVNGIPSVSTQKAQTQVLIPDGGTAVIGGILLDTDSSNLRQVPGLGSLPLIGHLFKNQGMIKSTAELLFFITPRILPQDNLNILATPPAPKPPGQER